MGIMSNSNSILTHQYVPQELIQFIDHVGWNNTKELHKY